MANLPINDPAKKEVSELLCNKLYAMGVISNAKTTDCDNITVSAFCRCVLLLRAFSC